MYIQSIKNELLLGKHEIIELKVRGKEKVLQQFFLDIQDTFDLAHDDWDESLKMLTMTFDKKPKEQTLNMVKLFTRDYLERRRVDSK